MIVLLDTNVFWADVNAVGQGLTTLFSACDEGLLDDAEVWTPKAVVGELVRQYPERIERIQKVLGEVEREFSAFRISAPDLPSTANVGRYQKDLEDRLTSPRRKIVGHPRMSSQIIDWVVMRRAPVRERQPAPAPKGQRDFRHFEKRKTEPVYGVADAAIWLTVIEAAARDQVALITNNSKDFCDGDAPSRPCPQLSEDLEAAGINPARVEVFPRVIDFNQRFVKPIREAQDLAEEFLADAGHREALKAAIAEAVEWYPLVVYPHDFEVEIDDATLQGIDLDSIDLKRADPAPDGVFAAMEATGQGQIELGIRKADAYGLSDDSDIAVWDWDWNESMVRADVEREVQLQVEVRLVRRPAEWEIMVSVDEMDLL